MSPQPRPTLTVERRDAIAERVVQKGAARVSELAKCFEVSPATIRRDLESLEDRGTLKRVHGGAVAADREQEMGQTSPASSRQASASPSAEAVRIGEAVANMIDDGETIFLGAGPLTLQVARSLQGHSRVTVVTNGLELAHWLATHTEHRLIMTGGQVEGRDLALVGQLVRDALSSLRADRVVLELGGVSAVEGLTHDSLPQAEIARVLLEMGSQVVIVVPRERVGRVAAAPVAPVTGADAVVTSREAPSAYLWDLSEVGVEIILA